MGEHNGLPPWLNLIWMCISACTLMGGTAWILFFFLPYCIETRKMLRHSLDLAENGYALSKDMLEKIGEPLRRLDEMLKIEDVPKMRQEVSDAFTALRRILKVHDPNQPILKPVIKPSKDDGRIAQTSETPRSCYSGG